MTHGKRQNQSCGICDKLFDTRLDLRVHKKNDHAY